MYRAFIVLHTTCWCASTVFWHPWFGSSGAMWSQCLNLLLQNWDMVAPSEIADFLISSFWISSLWCPDQILGSGRPSWNRCFPVNFLLRIDVFAGLAPPRPDSGNWPPLLECCFPINFLLRIDDFQAWRLRRQILGSGRPSWNHCFPFNFFKESMFSGPGASTARFWDLATPPGIVVFLLTSS